MRYAKGNVYFTLGLALFPVTGIMITSTKGREQNEMTNSQSNEFTTRIAINVQRMVSKGVSRKAAEMAVFEEINAKFPTAMASWIKHNAAC